MSFNVASSIKHGVVKILFFKADVTIPEHLKGKELWFSLKTAAEIIVKVNGKYVKEPTAAIA